MNTESLINAENLMLVSGIAGFVLTVYWVRSRELRERYAIGWMGVALVLLVCGLFPSGIMRFATAARLSYPAAVLFVTLVTGYFFSFFVTVSLTRQYRRTVRIMQEAAILKERLERLEAATAARGAGQ